MVRHRLTELLVSPSHQVQPFLEPQFSWDNRLNPIFLLLSWNGTGKCLRQPSWISSAWETQHKVQTRASIVHESATIQEVDTLLDIRQEAYSHSLKTHHQLLSPTGACIDVMLRINFRKIQHGRLPPIVWDRHMFNEPVCSFLPSRASRSCEVECSPRVDLDHARREMAEALTKLLKLLCRCCVSFSTVYVAGAVHFSRLIWPQ